jgi:hypothetical protein
MQVRALKIPPKGTNFNRVDRKTYNNSLTEKYDFTHLP